MLKQSIKVLVVAASVSALVACTSAKKKQDWSSEVYGPSHQVQTLGAGERDTFEANSAPTFANTQLTQDQIQSGQKIYFAYNKYNIEEAYNPIIRANVDYLLAHQNAKILIEGHTDEKGSREYNIALGEHRANSIKKALEQQGVPAAQIATVSYGKEYPVAACTDKLRCQLNRRGVIVFTTKG